MEKSFDFSAYLQNHEKKHKSKPTQFVSVAGGVKKRLENSIRNRKSTRLSVFDKIRNLPKAESPAPVDKVLSKIEHRRMQLEKWKAEKEKKKKEASLQKKKPFIAGVPHNPLKYVPPPPPPKVLPNTSGRVTRSQSAKQNTNSNVSKQKATKTDTKQTKKETPSFAPINATFKPPIFKNMTELPTLSQPKQADKRNTEKVLPSKEIKSRAKSKAVLKHETRTLRSRAQLTEKSNIKSEKLLSPIKSLTSNSSSSMGSSTDDNSSVMSKTPKIYVENPSSSSMGSSTEDNSSVISKTPKMSVENAFTNDLIIFTPNNKVPKSESSSEESENAFKNDLIIFTPNNKVPKSESSSEEKLRSPKPMTPEQIVEEAKKISPCVTLSRGKDNARKEMKKKLKEGLLDEDMCEIDNVEYFRRQLNSEIKRITEMCETWHKISQQVQLPEEVLEAVLGAVGQAKLLMSQKFKQFASLLARCESPDPSQPLVTPGDLHGFWDMLFMQIENVDMRFKKLEELRARGWVVEEKPVEVKKRVTKPTVNKSKPAVSSRLKDIIAAARKAKKLHQVENVPENPPTEESKKFEAGFFSVHSPVKSIQSTPVSKPSLLKAVLSNEAKKSTSKNSASYAMLRASLIGKNIENNDTLCAQDPVPLTPINLDATPARSILKSTKKSGKKSIKVVLFDESDSDITESNKLNNDSDISGVEKIETDEIIDNDKTSEEKENKKQSSRRKSKLIRQDAIEDRSPVMTRSRRKSLQTPNIEGVEEKKSGRKKALQEVEMNVDDVKETPRRSTRRKSYKNEVVA